MTLREQILKATDTQLLKVQVPEWGCDVWVSTWSGLDRAKVQAMHRDQGPDMIAKVVAVSLCDEQGVKLFTEADVPSLLEKSGAVLESIALKAIDHNGLNKADEAKNSSGMTPN